MIQALRIQKGMKCCFSFFSFLFSLFSPLLFPILPLSFFFFFSMVLGTLHSERESDLFVLSVQMQGSSVLKNMLQSPQPCSGSAIYHLWDLAQIN